MSPAPIQMTPARRRRQRILLTLWIVSPLAVLTLLCVWMYQSLKTPAYMNERPRGAGAGHTGMSNEYMGLGKDRPAGGMAATGAAGVTGATGTAAPTGDGVRK